MTKPAVDQLDLAERRFIESRRNATFATIGPGGRPRLVPICFVLAHSELEASVPALLTPLDEKRKRGDVRSLARVRDIVVRPQVSILFERWSEDWSRLAWLRAHGIAGLIEPNDAADAHRRAVEALRIKYPQYREQAIELAPMIRVELHEHVSWSATPGAMAS